MLKVKIKNFIRITTKNDGPNGEKLSLGGTLGLSFSRIEAGIQKMNVSSEKMGHRNVENCALEPGAGHAGGRNREPGANLPGKPGGPVGLIY